MQPSFVDQIVSAAWAVIRYTFFGFVVFVMQLREKFGLQQSGFILLVLGVAIFLILSRRSFYRRGVAGLERFSSFSSAIVVSSIEGIAGLFGVACFMTGLYFLAGFYLG